MSRILLIDDELGIIRVCTRVLTDMGHTVKSASSYAVGHELARQDDFDMLISDVCLPDGSGLDIVSQWRKEHPGAPFLVITGFATPNVPDDRRIHKPFDLKTFREAVNRALAGKEDA